MKRAFIGTGLIGAGLAEAACGRGDEVVVYNRTVSKAEALSQFGARVAPSAAEAAASSSRVHLALTSDPAVDAILTQIRGSLSAEAIVIDHSTTSPDATRQRAARLAKEGVSYLHVPVFMNPVACRRGLGVMVVAGPKAIYDQVAAELDQMTGKVWFVGEEGGRAASFKLAGNGMILTLLGGLTDVFALGKEQGVEPAEVLELFEHFNPMLAVKGRGRRMAEGNFSTQWTLRMARKDLGLMVEAAGEQPLTVLPAMGKRMDALIDDGEGEHDVGVLSRDVTGQKG